MNVSPICILQASSLTYQFNNIVCYLNMFLILTELIGYFDNYLKKEIEISYLIVVSS